MDFCCYHLLITSFYIYSYIYDTNIYIYIQCERNERPGRHTTWENLTEFSHPKVSGEVSRVGIQGRELSCVFRTAGLSPRWEAVVGGHALGSYAGAGLNRCSTVLAWDRCPNQSQDVTHLRQCSLQQCFSKCGPWQQSYPLLRVQKRLITIYWHHNRDNVGNYIMNQLCCLEKCNFFFNEFVFQYMILNIYIYLSSFQND